MLDLILCHIVLRDGHTQALTAHLNCRSRQTIHGIIGVLPFTSGRWCTTAQERNYVGSVSGSSASTHLLIKAIYSTLSKKV